MKFFINSLFLILFLELFAEYVAGQGGGRRQRANCPSLRISNGRVKIRSRGRIARFRCRRQYTLYGPKMAVCIGTNWSHQPPVCLAARCPDINIENSVQMTKDPKYKGALIEFSCEDGRTLEGVDVLYCNGTSWNADPPRCLYALAERECDFESQDLCGWTQDAHDQFDWIWHTGTTSTARTGPQMDHTLEHLNDTNGHYLYIETSSPRRPGDVARIYSPMYNAIESGYCFSVWYHMLGPDILNQVGALDLYIVPQGQSVFMVGPGFHTSGNKGDRWVKARVEIGAVNSSFQVVIAATRRNSYVSDIAIDDVKLYNCSEDIIEETTLSETTFIVEETTYEMPQTTEPEIVVSEVTAPVTSFSELPTTIQTTMSVITETKPSPTSTTFKVLSTTFKPEKVTTMTSAPEPEPETTNEEYDTSTTMAQKATTSPIETSKTTETVSTKQSTKTSTTKEIQPITEKIKETTKEVEISTFSTSIVTEMNTGTDGFGKTTTLVATTPSKVKLSTKQVITDNLTTTGYIGVETTKFDDSENEIDSTRKPHLSINGTSTDNSSTSTTDLPNVIHVDWGVVGDEDRLPTKPLLIGVGVGVAVGLLIIVIVIFAWIKRKRRKEAEFFEDEMAPIAKNACNEW